MERLFSTHALRKSRETAPLWRMTTLDAGGLDGPETVLLPGVWETMPQLRKYRGRAVYEQTIECGGNVRVWLGGVSFRAKVWLDEALLATHYGAYTGFEALALDVRRGMHVLRIEADNRFDEDSALHIPNDYYSYGGVNRPVVVEEVGDAYITRLHVAPYQREGVWHARVGLAVRNLTETPLEAWVTASAADAAEIAELTLAAKSETTAQLDLTCPEVSPWSPKAPTLYQLTATLTVDGRPVDDLVDRFGFRTIEAAGDRILLNGEPLVLKGFNRHEDDGCFGVSMPVEAMMRDLYLFRDLGANCVRTCHYPNDPRFLDLCDEMGMLVWEEAHARGLTEKHMRHPLFMEQTVQCVCEMVEQHFNHPSIFIWGCLNECADDCDYGADCFRQVYRLLDELDDTRPMTAALLERPGSKVYGDSDVVSVNIYPQWYHNTPVADCLDKKLEEIRAGGGGGKPLIVSEIGAGAIYGYHDPFGADKWSEERQCVILREQIEAVMRHPAVTGVFLWQFADVRVAEEWAMGRPKTCNNKGIVDAFRRPKMAYATVRELFHRF